MPSQPIKKDCEYCGKTFETQRHSQRFCSLACSNRGKDNGTYSSYVTAYKDWLMTDLWCPFCGFTRNRQNLEADKGVLVKAGAILEMYCRCSECNMEWRLTCEGEPER